MSPRYVPVSIRIGVLKVLAYSLISSSLMICGGGAGRPCRSHSRRASKSRRNLMTSSGRVLLSACFSDSSIRYLLILSVFHLRMTAQESSNSELYVCDHIFISRPLKHIQKAAASAVYDFDSCSLRHQRLQLINLP